MCSAPVVAEALVSITPGMYNNLAVGDTVFISFEENALEKPIILGKLFSGSTDENKTKGGMGIVDSFKARTAATIPSSTLFEFPKEIKEEYKNLKTPKKMADYIKWLEKLVKKFITRSDENFRCFKNWVQYQLEPENVEIDDGDIDKLRAIEEPFKYQKEGGECKICGSRCTKDSKRCYLALEINKNFPDI